MIESLAYTLIGINMLAYVMVRLRPRLYQTTLYKPMLTNIKLSLMPLVILMAAGTAFVVFQGLSTYFGGHTVFWWASILVAGAGFLIWLLMLPNAGYLVTELNLNHREQDKTEVPLWYDIIGILTLAMSGVMNMCFNVFIVQFMIAIFVRGATRDSTFIFDFVSWIVMAVLMLLSSFGIYLGRYIRFNSWDVRHPVQFIKKLSVHFKEKGTGKNCALFIVFHTLFFVVFYRATVGVVLSEMINSITF